MTEPIKVLKFDHSVRAEIYYDDDPMDPREHDHFATMVCWHRRSDLGDVTIRAQDFDSIIAIADHHKFVYWQPLWLYEHSGMTMRTTEGTTNPFVGQLPQGHAEFDSGMVGIIGITTEALDEYGPDRPNDALVRDIFRAEVEEYDQWLGGDVYGYVIKSPLGTHDACWGFFGIDDVEQEAHAAGEAAVRDFTREKEAVEHWAARGVETTS